MRLGDGGEMLPDFILVDTSKPTHIEVYGTNGNPDYERRKEEKRQIRRTPKRTLSKVGRRKCNLHAADPCCHALTYPEIVLNKGIH